MSPLKRDLRRDSANTATRGKVPLTTAYTYTDTGTGRKQQTMTTPAKTKSVATEAYQQRRGNDTVHSIYAVSDTGTGVKTGQHSMGSRGSYDLTLSAKNLDLISENAYDDKNSSVGKSLGIEPVTKPYQAKSTGEIFRYTDTGTGNNSERAKAEDLLDDIFPAWRSKKGHIGYNREAAVFP